MKISQREARRLKKRVDALEQQEFERRSAYASEWPGGVNITTTNLSVTDPLYVAILTARRLRHAVVCITTDDGSVRFYGVPLPESRV